MHYRAETATVHTPVIESISCAELEAKGAPFCLRTVYIKLQLVLFEQLNFNKTLYSKT